jgi:hypothetical protein
MDTFCEEELHMSSAEYLGYFWKGISLVTLAQWRYHDGWPQECSLCKQSIDCDREIWAVDLTKKKKVALMHVDCKNS